jgi:Caspase domain/Domain of unknown function (DUF4384)
MRNFLFHGLVLIASWLAFSAAAADGRHALIIGIGQYSEASNTPALSGVPQDMMNAKRIANEMGIPNGSIVMLRDEQATKSNIQSEFRKLADKVQTGDRVFIYHSGHGTRYPKGNSCLQGLQTYTPGKFMYDDILTEEELASYTKPISEKADKIIVMIDACFSGGVLNAATRSLGQNIEIRPKFNANASQSCENVGINQGRSRSLLSEIKRLGIYEENFVQIAAAKDNEVSWDNKELGGLATHTLTQCLMGQAKDINASGAVSLDEVRICAQTKLDEMMKPHEKAGLLPSTIQVRGNRNLIPVATVKPPTSESLPPSLPTPAAIVNVTENKPPPVLTVSPVPVDVIKPPAMTSNETTVKPPVIAETERPPTLPAQQKPPKLELPSKPPATEAALPPALASLETLKDIVNQRNPRRLVDTKLDKPVMKIGVDELKLTVKSSHDGYLYVVLLGSDAKSFYVMYPNGLDTDNKISKQKPVQIPKPHWQIKAAGPAGTDQLLILVTDSPRQINSLSMAPPTASEPFTFALNDIGGRAALIDFLTGSGVNGRSSSFGAQLLMVKEVEK